MNKSSTSNPVFILLAANVYHLYGIAKSYLNGAENLDKEEDSNLHLQLEPFQLLATNAFELFLKLIIICDVCLAHKDESLSSDTIREIVLCEMKKSGHNLRVILKKAKIENEFSINKVEEISNGFINEYRIHFSNGKSISFKDSEAVRYGSFASKQNLAISSYGNRSILDFLNKLDVFVRNKIATTQNIFKNL